MIATTQRFRSVTDKSAELNPFDNPATGNERRRGLGSQHGKPSHERQASKISPIVIFVDKKKIVKLECRHRVSVIAHTFFKSMISPVRKA